MNVSPRVVSNCAGFFENETRRMLRAATPASNLPDLSPLRGSLALGYVCAARSEGTPSSATSANILRDDIIGDSSGWGRVGSLVGQLRQHPVHRADLRGLNGDDIVREDVHVHLLTGARSGE